MTVLNTPKGKPIGIIFFLISLAVLILLGILRFRNIQVDDAYITYRYARHLASGQGFSYNPPLPDFGTTTPLYTLLLTLTALLGINIPSASLFFCGISLFTITALFALYGWRQGYGLGTYLPALMVMLLPGSVLILGMETAFYTALIYITLYLAARKQYTLAIIFAAMATLTRYDGLLVAVLVISFEWYVKKILPIKRGLLYVGILFIWFLYATLTFGSFLPNSFLAKTGEFSGNLFLDELTPHLFLLTGFFSTVVVPNWVIFFGLIAFFLISGVWVSGMYPRLVLIWCFLYLSAYALLGIRYTFHWYYYPPLPGMILVFVLSVQTFREKVCEKFNWLSAQGLVVLLLVPIFTIIALGNVRLVQQADTTPALGGRNAVYTLAAEWICQHSSEETTIAVPEIGLIGWYCDRKIIDPYGLVSPEMIPYVQNGDRLAGVIALRPDLIVITNVPKDGRPFSIPEPDRFHDEYFVSHAIERENFPYFLVIFEKRK